MSLVIRLPISGSLRSANNRNVSTLAKMSMIAAGKEINKTRFKTSSLPYSYPVRIHFGLHLGSSNETHNRVMRSHFTRVTFFNNGL